MELSIRLPPEGRGTCQKLPLPSAFFKREDINNMKKSYTRIIAFLLSVVMCIGLLPVTSFAAADQPLPEIDSLTKNEDAKLLCVNNHTYDRTIVSVEHTEYEEAIPEKSQYNTDDLVVGEVTIYIDEAMQGDFDYALSANALNVTAKHIPEGYGTDIDNFWPAQFSTKTSVYHSNSIANNDDDIWYVYRVKIAVAEAPVQTFPKIDSLTKNEGAKLLCVNNHTYDRTIVSVEHTEYEEAIPEKSQYNTDDLVVGEVTIYIDEAMQGDFDYALSANALNVTAKHIPEGYGTDIDNFWPAQFSTKTSVYHSNSIANNDDDIWYVYRVKIAVAEKNYDYPVLQSLSVKSNAALVGVSDKTTISIIDASFENYDSARDIKMEGYPAKVAGKVTLYISKEPSKQIYNLLASDLDVVYTVKEGFELNNNLQGSFPTGSTSTVSGYYAYNKSQDCEYFYDLELVAGYPDNDNVYLKDGVGARITPTSARISFDANQAGTYHYAVVDAAATDIPAMPDTGAEMKAGENTFVIDKFAEGAKKVYIWGKNGEKVSARPVVVEISEEVVTYSLIFDTTAAATDGIFRITADGKDVSFKTRIMVTPTTEAKGIYEGQLVTVWMGNPHTDKNLSAVTLRNVKDVTIAPDKNSFSFTMPAADVYGTSNDWRTYVDSTETRYTLTGTATTFDQTNVTGIPMGKVIFADTNGNIITQAKKGTVVKATPVPYTANQNLEFAFTGWSDADGFTLADANKTENPLTFTVDEKNVSLKANFKPKGTMVTWGTNITSQDENAPQVSMPGAVTSPYVFKQKQTVTAFIDGKAWYDRYEFKGWKVTRDDETLTGDAVDTKQEFGTSGTPGYWTSAAFTIDGNKMTVTAQFEERAFAYVNVETNDATMGSATVSVNGSAAAANKLVFEGQTVTLTATPNKRHMLTRWEVKDSDGTVIEVTPVTPGDNTQVTFKMPGTRKDITAKAFFAVDPNQPNDDCSLLRVELWSADGKNRLASSNKSGDTYTIELPADEDVKDLPDLRLKFICGDAEHAVVKQGDTMWDESKGCGYTELKQEKVFTVTAEDNQTSATYKVVINAETKITAVTLLDGTTPIATGTLTGAKWTITLRDSIDADLLTKIGASDKIFMKIEYAGKSLKQVATTNGAGYDDAGQEKSWASGKVMCAISPGSEAQFIVTGIDGLTKEYTIAITRPDVSTTPVLTKVSVERTSDTAATVKFNSSMAGNYFYKVVEQGAAVGTVDTTKGGSRAEKGENTITLTNLAAGARDIYIVVKSLSNVECDPFKIEIPAYGSTETPDEGDFTIAVNAPPTGGTITTNRTRANEGDEIIVTVTPKTGYQMKAGSLRYAFSTPGAAYTAITGYSFKMPGGNIDITCDWETASTTVDGITAFSINGIAAAVNNTTNTITITMPRGTDVTKLTPVIATNGVKSLTPGSGVTMDFTNAVTYTATMDDGSTKTYIVTVYVNKGTLADQFWDKLTDFVSQVPWWEYAKHQQSTSSYPKYW